MFVVLSQRFEMKTENIVIKASVYPALDPQGHFSASDLPSSQGSVNSSTLPHPPFFATENLYLMGTCSPELYPFVFHFYSQTEEFRTKTLCILDEKPSSWRTDELILMIFCL